MSNVDVGVFELKDRRSSNFVLQGSEEAGMPVVLDCPSRRRIHHTSTMLDDKKNLKRIRYTQFATTIDLQQQITQGQRWNPNTDQIYFEGGRLTVTGTGAGKQLLEYLRNCAYNAGAPNRPEGSPDIFYEIKKAEITKKSIKQSKDELKAASMCDRLVDYDAKENPVYDEERIQYIAKILNIVGLNDIGDVFLAILQVAKTNPEYFLTTIANITNEYIFTVRAAKELGVLGVDGPQAVFTGSNAPFLNFNSKNAAERENQIVEYFLSKEGEKDYAALVIDLNHAKEKRAL